MEMDCLSHNWLRGQASDLPVKHDTVVTRVVSGPQSGNKLKTQLLEYLGGGSAIAAVFNECERKFRYCGFTSLACPIFTVLPYRL